MGNQVRVQSVQALEILQSRMSQFGVDSRQALAAVERRIAESMDWVNQRLRHWQQEVRVAQQAVSQASAALARCQASGYRDSEGRYHAPDCSAYIQALSAARSQLQKAQSELANTQQWLQRLKGAADTYRRETHHLLRFVDRDLPHALSQLNRKIAALHAYLAVSSLRSAGGVSITQKRRGIEHAAEAATRSRLYGLGYHSVFSAQHDGIHGVDLGALKYSQKGKPIAGAIIEVKGRSGPTPGPSAFQKQVRPGYYLPRLYQAKQAGVPGASSLYHLAKRHKVTSYGATYGKQGLRVYSVPQRGPIPKKPI